MPQEPLGKESRWSEKSTRTIFFLSAVLFHLVLFLAIAGWILFPAPPLPTPDPGPVSISTPPAPVDPPSLPIDPQVGAHAPSAPLPIFTSGPSNINISIKIPGIDTSEGNSNRTPLPPVPTPSPKTNLDTRLPKIRAMEEMRRTRQQIADKDPSCTFPVYIASYADGDWSCNTRLDKDGNIEAGSIPNLVAKISEWSHGSIKGEVVPKPLNIASHELMDKMPPFIFFTGHKDITLTDEEVANLRSYLMDGGMIWGDNALAGEGSRFDVAFHREMKRVIPDKDKNFMSYSLSDDIFSKGKYPLTEIPMGMNYYAEAPQHLDIDGILAILYTPNDYSDMMFMKINPDDASFFMTYKPIPDGTLYTNTSFVEKKSIFYRNFDLKSSLAVHHMGMDIITYLITRFDDKLQLAP